METIADLVRQLALKGARRYGDERVSILHHSLQCGALAEAEGAAPALVAAAFLHDVGHVLHDERGAARQGHDMRHEDLAAEVLRRWFGPDVVEPVRLHVAAKRYLCAVEPDYFAGLSEGSVISLNVQGGPFTPAEAEAFIRRPHAPDAVRLRRWDEGAKVVGRDVPPAEHFLGVAETAARAAGPA